MRFFWITAALLAAGLVVYIKSDGNTQGIKDELISTGTPKVYDLPEKVEWAVPFTPQAPTGKWQDVKLGNGCEEASILMAYWWIKGREIEPAAAAKEIEKMSDYSLRLLGHFHDISNEDTIKLFREYFKYENLFLDKKVSVENIKKVLSEGKILMAGVNGDFLANPYYQIPKPANHKLVIIGYDEKKQEFITHDPGTSRGKGYRYDYLKLIEAITDYPTGYRESFEKVEKSLIIVEKTI